MNDINNDINFLVKNALKEINKNNYDSAEKYYREVKFIVDKLINLKS